MSSERPLQLVPRGQPAVRRFRFGTFELDVELGELRQTGVRLPLHGQPLQVLELLLRATGELVSREQLRDTLWSDGRIVEFDDSLNNCVRRLRQALGDDATTPTFIETIPRRGYRFLGEVTAETGAGATGELPAAQLVPQHRYPSTPESALPGPLAATDGPMPLSRRWRRWQRLALLAGLLGMGILAIAYLAAGRTRRPAEAQLRQLTSRRGLIFGGRFSPGADRVIFSAAWDGGPTQPYVLSVASGEMRPLGIPDARVLAVSRTGEVALVLHPNSHGVGVLAIIPDVGGAPRQLLENVYAADWSPDGNRLAVVRYVGGKSRLEFPIGTVVYESDGQIFSPRVSKRGEVAFAKHPANAMAGDLLVWEPSGNVRTVVEGWGYKGAGVVYLAWAPSGEEIWFTGSRENEENALWAVTRSGVVRSILRREGSLWLMDLAPDGRTLLQEADAESGTEVFGLDPDRPRQGWGGGPLVDLSNDGWVLTFGFAHTDSRLRKLDGSRKVHLGAGMPLALSPDGQWALVQRWEGPSHPGRLFLLPTGNGSERPIPSEPLHEVTIARWFRGGVARVALAARERDGSGHRFYVLDLDGGRPRPVSPPGVGASFLAVSPDGQWLAGIDDQGQVALFPVDGGEPRTIPGMPAGLVPVGWSREWGLLVIPEVASAPVLSRIDVRTGKIEPITTLEPTDPVGVRSIRRVLLTPDERTVVFGYSRFTGLLNLVESPRAP